MDCVPTQHCSKGGEGALPHPRAPQILVRLSRETSSLSFTKGWKTFLYRLKTNGMGIGGWSRGRKYWETTKIRGEEASLGAARNQGQWKLSGI